MHPFAIFQGLIICERLAGKLGSKTFLSAELLRTILHYLNLMTTVYCVTAETSASASPWRMWMSSVEGTWVEKMKNTSSAISGAVPFGHDRKKIFLFGTIHDSFDGHTYESMKSNTWINEWDVATNKPTQIDILNGAGIPHAVRLSSGCIFMIFNCPFNLHRFALFDQECRRIDMAFDTDPPIFDKQCYCPLADGRVMMMGGRKLVMRAAPGAPVDGSGLVTIISMRSKRCAILRPSAGTWTPAADMISARHDFAAVLLPNGQVFACGEPENKDDPSAEIYDPNSNTWTLCAPMGHPRTGHKAVLTSCGTKVFVCGEETYTDNAKVPFPPEIYHIEENRWEDRPSIGFPSKHIRSVFWL